MWDFNSPESEASVPEMHASIFNSLVFVHVLSYCSDNPISWNFDNAKKTNQQNGQ